MNFYINTDVVNAELNQIDKCIDELRSTLGSIESNISSGWNSDRAQNVVTPIIENVKGSINEMQTSVMSVRDNVKQYVSNVQSANTAGSLGNSTGGMGAGVNTNMMK